MKPKFIVRGRTTPDGMKMLVRAAYGKKLRMRILTSALLALLAAAFAAFSPQKTLALILLAISRSFLFFFVRSKTRMADKLMAALPNQALVTEFRFTDEKIETQTAEEEGWIHYSAILTQWMDRDFFAFYLEDGSAFVLAKADFVSGQVGKFPGFLHKMTQKPVREVGRWL